MSVRYIHQLVRALDDKIGSDLRGVVEQYLGPDPERGRLWHQAVVEVIPRRVNREDVIWSEDDLELRERPTDWDPCADYLQPKIFRLLRRGRQIWRYNGKDDEGGQACYGIVEDDRSHCRVEIYGNWGVGNWGAKLVYRRSIPLPPLEDPTDG